MGPYIVGKSATDANVTGGLLIPLISLFFAVALILPCRRPPVTELRDEAIGNDGN